MSRDLMVETIKHGITVNAIRQNKTPRAWDNIFMSIIWAIIIWAAFTKWLWDKMNK